MYFVDLQVFPGFALLTCSCDEAKWMQQDTSSVSTFKGVRKVLHRSRPHVLMLENVDSIDSQTGPEEDDTKESKRNP